MSSRLNSYFYPAALIIIVSVGSVYGASLKEEDKLEKIKQRIEDPGTRIKELEAYRERLIAQRLVHAKRLRTWEAKLAEKEAEAS